MDDKLIEAITKLNGDIWWKKKMTSESDWAEIVANYYSDGSKQQFLFCLVNSADQTYQQQASLVQRDVV